MAQYEWNSKVMLYGRRFGFVFMDEAHSGCKYNMMHITCWELRKMAGGLVALTATPVTTKAQVCVVSFSVPNTMQMCCTGSMDHG